MILFVMSVIIHNEIGVKAITPDVYMLVAPNINFVKTAFYCNKSSFRGIVISNVTAYVFKKDQRRRRQILVSMTHF